MFSVQPISFGFFCFFLVVPDGNGDNIGKGEARQRQGKGKERKEQESLLDLNDWGN